MSINWPAEINSASFLQKYWQKKALLVRNAFTHPPEIISPEELAGMAMESEIESRIISNYPEASKWHLLHGPFEEDVFAELPVERWTLLVQDVDKHIPEARQLINYFDFIPSWRIDDLMISYAVDQGSVGPHTDSYDVFLIQLKGKRLWQISDGTYSDDDLLADSEVKVLTNFKKHHEWLLEPGDMLYLPPNVAHWGIAQGDCLTASVGFLAPTASELFSAWSESKMQSSMGKIHYSDPDLDYRDSPCEITAADINKVEKIISNLIQENPVLTQKWFGEMISQSKAHLEIIPNSDAIVNLEQHPEAGLRYTRHPFLRMFYTVTKESQLLLFANGESFELDASEKDFAEYLCENTGYDVDELKQWMDNNKNKACFISLLSLGFIEFEEK